MCPAYDDVCGCMARIILISSALTQELIAEARAALAAVEWGTGQQAKAEEQLEAATAMQSGWGKINFVRDHTRWPPRLYAALEKMLSFSPM